MYLKKKTLIIKLKLKLIILHDITIGNLLGSFFDDK